VVNCVYTVRFDPVIFTLAINIDSRLFHSVHVFTLLVLYGMTTLANSPRSQKISSARTASSPSKATTAKVARAAPDADAHVKHDALHLPSPWIRKLILGAVGLHLCLVATSYASSIGASDFQTRALALFRTYLSIFHFDADGVTLAFSDSSASEKTHRWSTSTSTRPDSEDQWNPANDPASALTMGFAGGDRQRRVQRLLAAIARLGENEQGTLAAWLVTPIAKMQPEANFVRITREPDLMTNVVEDSASPPYVAAIIRSQDQPPRPIQSAPKRLASPTRTKSLAESLP
jgi:hypothetical protein